MSTITMAKLSKRLGISRAAITQAARAEKIDMDGELVNLDGERTRAYLARFTLHRGKQKQPEPQSPEAADALRRRLHAQYNRGIAKLERRKAQYIPAAIPRAAAAAMLASLTEGLEAMPSGIDLSGDAEAALTACAVAVMEKAKAAGRNAGPAWLAERKGQQANTLPASLDPDLPLATLRAAIDDLTAHRHRQEQAIETGTALHKDQVQQRFGKIDADAFGMLRKMPRRYGAELQAVIEAEGREAARARLTGNLVADTLRLKEVFNEK
jgi:hypothetical protein